MVNATGRAKRRKDPGQFVCGAWRRLFLITGSSRCTKLQHCFHPQNLWFRGTWALVAILLAQDDTALFVPYTRLGLSPDACFYCRVAIKKYRPQWRSVQTGTMINMICFCVANPMRTNLYKRQIRFDSDLSFDSAKRGRTHRRRF